MSEISDLQKAAEANAIPYIDSPGHYVVSQVSFIAGANWYKQKLIPIFSLLGSITNDASDSECMQIATKIIIELKKI